MHISQRVDRMLLLSVFEQGCQRLQVKMNLFGVVRDERVQEPKDSATLAAALAFLRHIAEMYMTGKLTKEQLIPYRNEALRSLKDKAGTDKVKGKNSGNKGKRKEKARVTKYKNVGMFLVYRIRCVTRKFTRCLIHRLILMS